ncbi:RING-H2 finger protein ATL80-like isoform X1 [Triticum urartu]|nr:RING-H2 finger protein ATL80-like isoform X1 [Triticum urartu]
MPRHLLQQPVDRLAAMAAAPAVVAGGGTSVHTDTLLILAAVLCFVLCVVGLGMVARCSRMCNPSAFSVDAPGAMAKSPCKGMKKKALESLPTVSWQPEPRKVDEERPECAICLAEFTRGDEVRVLPHCGHGFHAACVDVWLLSSSTCPSCRRALVVAAAQSPAATESPPPQTCRERADVVAAAQASAAGTVADESGVRTRRFHL